MNRLQAVFLILISLGSCSPVQNLVLTQKPIPDLAPVIPFEPETRIIYKAGIDIFDKHVSGLFIFRKAPDHKFGYISLISELGIELVRFRLQDGALKKEYAMKAFDKKIILNSLSMFLLLLVDELNASKTNTYLQKDTGDPVIVEKQKGLKWEFWYPANEKYPERIAFYKRRKTVFIIHLHYSKHQKTPDKIDFNHQKVPFSIHLKKL